MRKVRRIANLQGEKPYMILDFYFCINQDTYDYQKFHSVNCRFNFSYWGLPLMVARGELYSYL